jgi:hypothetical protein
MGPWNGLRGPQGAPERVPEKKRTRKVILSYKKEKKEERKIKGSFKKC